MPAINLKNKINIFGGNSMKIKYKDIFDMSEFYDALKGWVEEHGWTDTFEGTTDENWETLYSEKISRGGGREIVIRWRLKRKPEYSEQIMFYLDLDFHTLALSSTEVIHDGKKISADKGEIELVINGFVETKYLEHLEQHSILKYIKTLFVRRVYDPAPKIKELYQEVYGLQNYIKQWFKLKRYLPYEEIKGFHPSHAYPSHQK